MSTTQEKTKPKNIHFNDDTFDWLMACTTPATLKVGFTTLDMYGYNEALRQLQAHIQQKRMQQ